MKLTIYKLYIHSRIMLLLFCCCCCCAIGHIYARENYINRHNVLSVWGTREIFLKRIPAGEISWTTIWDSMSYSGIHRLVSHRQLIRATDSSVAIPHNLFHFRSSLFYMCGFNRLKCLPSITSYIILLSV